MHPRMHRHDGAWPAVAGFTIRHRKMFFTQSDSINGVHTHIFLIFQTLTLSSLSHTCTHAHHKKSTCICRPSVPNGFDTRRHLSKVVGVCCSPNEYRHVNVVPHVGALIAGIVRSGDPVVVGPEATLRGSVAAERGAFELGAPTAPVVEWQSNTRNENLGQSCEKLGVQSRKMLCRITTSR